MKEVERLKYELSAAIRKSCSDLTVKVTLTINAYGIYTQYEERDAESLKTEGISMRNLKKEWIK